MQSKAETQSRIGHAPVPAQPAQMPQAPGADSAFIRYGQQIGEQIISDLGVAAAKILVNRTIHNQRLLVFHHSCPPLPFQLYHIPAFSAHFSDSLANGQSPAIWRGIADFMARVGVECAVEAAGGGFIDRFANRSIPLCKERNLTSNGISYIAGVPQSTVKSILNGESQNPGTVTIKKLCDGFEIMFFTACF